MRHRSSVALVLLCSFLGVLVVVGATSATPFTSTRAQVAHKKYIQAVEKLNAEYEAKLKRIRSTYLKSLGIALRMAKRKKDTPEAERIATAIEKVKLEAKKPAKAAPGKKKSGKSTVEKIGAYTFTGGDGSSYEQAVVIGDAEDSVGAVTAEGLWLKKHYPGHTKKGQAVGSWKGKTFDRITIEVSGETKTIYFDITDCFGFPGG